MIHISDRKRKNAERKGKEDEKKVHSWKRRRAEFDICNNINYVCIFCAEHNR